MMAAGAVWTQLMCYNWWRLGISCEVPCADDMYVCLFLCVFVYVLFVHVCVYVYVSACICVWVCMCVCVCVCFCASPSGWMCVCMSVFVYECVCVCMCIFVLSVCECVRVFVFVLLCISWLVEIVHLPLWYGILWYSSGSSTFINTNPGNDYSTHFPGWREKYMSPASFVSVRQRASSLDSISEHPKIRFCVPHYKNL